MNDHAGAAEAPADVEAGAALLLYLGEASAGLGRKTGRPEFIDKLLTNLLHAYAVP